MDVKRHRQQKRRKQTTKKTSFTFYNFWYDWNVGCFLLHQNLLLNIAHVRRWLHPGCGIGTAPREWEVLRTDTALGILPGCRALMAPMVQRRIEEVRVHKHFLTSCICPAAAAVSASPLEPSCSLLPCVPGILHPYHQVLEPASIPWNAILILSINNVP